MKIKRIVYTILLIIWMIVIFVFSNQDSTTSQSTSDKVASNIVSTVETVTKEEISEEDKSNFIENTRVLIRKLAHFFLYFILGILTYLTFSSYNLSKIYIITIIFCFLYACSDEVHQLFSSGRTFKFLDIIIDTLGSCTGCLLIYTFNKLHK